MLNHAGPHWGIGDRPLIPSPYAFTGTTAQVALSSLGDGNVIADAIRIVPVETAGAITVDHARWAPPEALTYDVYARWPASASHSPQATYSVKHSGGTTDVVRNQQAGGGSWSLAGTYTFSDVATQSVALLADPEYAVAADAVRFVPAGSSVYKNQTAYFHVDHLGMPQKLTDSTQAVVWDASYEPFGKATITAEPYFENPLRFPGQYFDAETGLHQNWHRDYDPSIGRYLQSDPIGLEGGISTYNYVAANPLNSTDRMGLLGQHGGPVRELGTDH